MRPPLGWLSAALALALCGCATQRAALSASPAATPSALEGAACSPQTLLALCATDGCHLYQCSAVAPALASVRQLRRPGALRSLPGLIDTRPPSRYGQVQPGMFLTRGTGAAENPPAPAHMPEQVIRVPDRDVIQYILLLRKPLDVAWWWRAGPGQDPGCWRSPESAEM